MSSWILDSCSILALIRVCYFYLLFCTLDSISSLLKRLPYPKVAGRSYCTVFAS